MFIQPRGKSRSIYKPAIISINAFISIRTERLNKGLL